MGKIFSKKEVIDRFNSVHNSKYDYSLMEYKTQNSKIRIICSVHGEYIKIASDHYRGRGCGECLKEENRIKYQEQYINKFKEFHGDKYDYSEVRYINAKTNVKIKCKDHGYFYQSPDKHRRAGCPKCVGRNKKTSDIIKEFKAVHGDKYDYSLVKYEKSAKKLKIICKKHGIFLQSYNSHVRNHGCPNCGFESMGEKQKSSNEYFIRKAIEVHGDTFDYSDSKYNGWRRKVKIICSIHGHFSMTPVYHIQFKNGCPHCHLESKRLAEEKAFIEKAIKLHKGLYLYDEVKYVKSNRKVLIRCKKHGVYKQTPNSHISKKSGCPRCIGRGKTTAEVIEEFKEIHGDKYDYSLVVYQKACKKVKVICKKHGPFFTSVAHHKYGRGCPRCFGFNFSISDLIAKFRDVHGEKYSYERVSQFKGSNTKVDIKCGKHGFFKQSIGSHSNGAGCPRCKTSKGENKIRDFLTHQNIAFIDQHPVKGMHRKYYIDFYLPDYNLFIEYHGKQHYERIPLWHKTQKAFERQLTRDQKLRDLCQQRGIDLLEIGYFDFDRIKEILSEKLLGVEVKRSKQLKLQL